MDGQPASDSPLSYVLVRAGDRAATATVSGAIERAVPGARAFSRDEITAITRTYWIGRTNLGFILALGALLGVVVGAVVVADVLYASVNEHRREYGTLKALGIDDRSLYGAIVVQAVALAVLGYVPGLLLGLAVAHAAGSSHRVEVLIAPLGALSGLAAAVLMCIVAALFAVQRAVRIDPALVFNG